jgi:ribonucleoside-triphosphate reductase
MDGKVMKVSGDHLVAVYTEKGIVNKKAKEIIAEDILLTTRGAVDVLNINKLRVKELEIDEDMAFFMGLFIADGVYIYDSRKEFNSYHKAKGIQISFHSQDVLLMNKMNSIIKNKFNKELKFVKDKR